jgi:hypothetical protein
MILDRMNDDEPSARKFEEADNSYQQSIKSSKPVLGGELGIGIGLANIRTMELPDYREEEAKITPRETYQQQDLLNLSTFQNFTLEK